MTYGVYINKNEIAVFNELFEARANAHGDNLSNNKVNRMAAFLYIAFTPEQLKSWAEVGDVDFAFVGQTAALLHDWVLGDYDDYEDDPRFERLSYNIKEVRERTSLLGSVRATNIYAMMLTPLLGEPFVYGERFGELVSSIEFYGHVFTRDFLIAGGSLDILSAGILNDVDSSLMAGMHS